VGVTPGRGRFADQLAEVETARVRACRRYVRFFVRLPQIDIAHHAAERFFERSKKAYPQCRHALSLGQTPVTWPRV
jgi:hypothetical protein